MELKKVCDIDAEDAENGRWFTYNEDDDGTPVQFCIAREGNTKYKRLAKKLFKQYAIQIRHKRFDDEKAEPLIRKLYAKTILVGWRNLEEDGVPLEYSPETAERIFVDYPLLFEWVKEIAMEISAFAKEEKDDEIKN